MTAVSKNVTNNASLSKEQAVAAVKVLKSKTFCCERKKHYTDENEALHFVTESQMEECMNLLIEKIEKVEAVQNKTHLHYSTLT